jgi:chromosome partitioning protein
MIIALLNQKGGVGKSTLSSHIADYLARTGKRVLLVDADPQGSALDWSESRPENPRFPVIGLPKASLHKELAIMAKDYDAVLIDGPPRVNEIAKSAIAASDIVLIPVQPSPYDVWAAKEIVDLIEEVSQFKENLKTAFVINRKIANTAIGRDVADALAVYPIPVLKSSVCQRVAFAESAAQGLTVMDVEPNGSAAKEIEALVNELLEL